MNTEEFRRQAKKTIDYICEYRDTASQRRVYPGENVKVNYLKKLISSAYRYIRFELLLGDFVMFDANK